MEWAYLIELGLFQKVWLILLWFSFHRQAYHEYCSITIQTFSLA